MIRLAERTAHSRAQRERQTPSSHSPRYPQTTPPYTLRELSPDVDDLPERIGLGLDCEARDILERILKQNEDLSTRMAAVEEKALPSSTLRTNHQGSTISSRGKITKAKRGRIRREGPMRSGSDDVDMVADENVNDEIEGEDLGVTRTNLSVMGKKAKAELQVSVILNLCR